MMDEVHQRPAGTAKRTFGKHRGKLLEDVEYFEVARDEWGALFSGTQNVPEMRGRDSRILLTESGYPAPPEVGSSGVASRAQRKPTLKSRQLAGNAFR